MKYETEFIKSVSEILSTQKNTKQTIFNVGAKLSDVLSSLRHFYIYLNIHLKQTYLRVTKEINSELRFEYLVIIPVIFHRRPSQDEVTNLRQYHLRQRLDQENNLDIKYFFPDPA